MVGLGAACGWRKQGWEDEHGAEREVEGWCQIREAHGTCLLTALESWFQRVIRGVAVVGHPQA